MASLADMWSTVDPGATYDTSNAEVAPTKIASVGSQWDQMVYGTFRDHKEYIDQTLQQIGQQTGLPANFDWKPYLEQAARDHIQTYGKTWDERYSNNAEPVVKVIQFAMQDNPQLRPIYQQIGPGTAYWQQGEAARQSAASSSKASDKQNTIRLLSVLAMPVAAAFLGPAAGATEGAGTGAGAAGAGVGESVSGAYGATAGELGAAGASYGAAGAGTVGAGAAIGGSTAEAGGAGITSAGTGAGAAGAGAGGVTTTQAAAAAPLAQQLANSGSNGPNEYPTDEYGNQLIPPPTTQSNGAPLQKDTSTDYWRMAGQVLPSLISAYGSNEQRKSQEQLAAEYRAMGAPYRSRLADLYANPNAFLTSPEVTIPVQQGTDSLARALSVRGNPAGSGTALQEIQNYSANQLFGRLGQEKDRLAGFGGLSFYNQAAPGASQAAINAQGQVYGDLGYGVGSVMNPQQYNNNQSLAAILKAYNTSQGLT